jgi:hypothetical protein
MMKGRFLFLLIVVIELAHTILAIAQHRVPTGHDGFQYFTVQYYFLNNAIQAGEIPQWIPYMTQGTVATLWYAIQASMLQSVLLFAAPALRHVDLLAVYHAGMFVDEMTLLAGTWLLARRFFRTPASLFIAITVVGSCVWLEQPYWNFRLYYALPLVLEAGHRFIDSGRWRWAFLSANLLALQALGNLPYFLPVASFVVCAYFAFFAAAHWDVMGQALKRLRWGLPAVTAVAMAGASFVLVYACLSSGTSQLVSYNPGRLRDGSTSLAGFLTYGGATDVHKWLGLVVHTPASVDFTIYAGVLVAPLLLCGLFAVDRRRLHFVLLAATMLLFTLGTFVSTMAFYAWPGMKYFRHIGLVTPLVKVLCCFVAGIGFEWVADTRTHRARRALQYALLAFVFADVYHFKFSYLFDHSDTIDEPSRFVTSPSPLGYSRRRVVDLQQAALAGDFPRLQAALTFSPMLLARLEGHATREAEYWSNNAFFFADEAGSSFRVDSWLKPLDQFMRMSWSLPIDDTAALPAGIDLDRLRFPLELPGARRLVGIDADKIRFFAHAYQVESAERLVPLLTHPAYAGNILFVCPIAAAAGAVAPLPWTSQVRLDADESQALPYDIRQFDSNNIVISVANPDTQPVWMAYADVWHPFWEATVNGRNVPVYQAEMAYKAVRLDPGDNVVHFRFRLPMFSILSACVAADSVLWLCLAGWMIMRSALQS